MSLDSDGNCAREDELADLQQTDRKHDQRGLELAARVTGLERKEARTHSTLDELFKLFKLLSARVGDADTDGRGPSGLYKAIIDHVNPHVRAEFISAHPSSYPPSIEMADALGNESEDTKSNCPTRSTAILAKRQAEIKAKEAFEQVVIHEAARMEAERRLQEANKNAVVLAEAKESADRRQAIWKWGATAAIAVTAFVVTAEHLGLFKLIAKLLGG